MANEKHRAQIELLQKISGQLEQISDQMQQGGDILKIILTVMLGNESKKLEEELQGHESKRVEEELQGHDESKKLEEELQGPDESKKPDEELQRHDESKKLEDELPKLSRLEISCGVRIRSLNEQIAASFRSAPKKTESEAEKNVNEATRTIEKKEKKKKKAESEAEKNVKEAIKVPETKEQKKQAEKVIDQIWKQLQPTLNKNEEEEMAAADDKE